MDEISLVFGGIQTASIVAGIVLALMELRHLREQRKIELETRQTQLFTQVVAEMNGAWLVDFFEMLNEWTWESFDDFEKKYAPLVNRKSMNIFSTVEHLGILVNDGLLSPRLLHLWFGLFFIQLWGKYESVIMEQRKKYTELMFEFFETLVIAMKKEELNDQDDFRKRQIARRLAWESFSKPTT